MLYEVITITLKPYLNAVIVHMYINCEAIMNTEYGRFTKTKYFIPGCPIAILKSKNTKEEFNKGSNKLYRRDFWKIFYIEDGKGTLVINGRRYPLTPGFIGLVRPDDLSTYELDIDCHMYNILFSPDTFSGWLDNFPEHNDPLKQAMQDISFNSSLMRDQHNLLTVNRKILSIIHRITSYNVCYTKLLRVVQGGKAKECWDRPEKYPWK